MHGAGAQSPWRHATLSPDRAAVPITVPARVVSPQRRVNLHLPAAWLWQSAWTELFAQVWTASGTSDLINPVDTRTIKVLGGNDLADEVVPDLVELEVAVPRLTPAMR